MIMAFLFLKASRLMQTILQHQVWIAFAVTFLAGLATVIDIDEVFIGFIFQAAQLSPVIFQFGFSAGAMVYVSLTEILNKSMASFRQVFEPKFGFALGTFVFLFGSILILLLDHFIPNPHQILELNRAAELE